jgi:hypothetical protein
MRRTERNRRRHQEESRDFPAFICVASVVAMTFMLNAHHAASRPFSIFQVIKPFAGVPVVADRALKGLIEEMG